MKNVLLIFCITTLVFNILLLGACSNPEAEAEMNRIAIHNEALKRTVDSLQEEIIILLDQSDSLQNALKSLDMHK